MMAVVTSKLMMIPLIFLCCCSLKRVSSSISSTGEVYVDYLTGNDSEVCGSLEEPCKSLHFSWYRFLAPSDGGNSSNIVTFNLASGVYNGGETTIQPLSYRCNNGSVAAIAIKTQDPDDFVEFHYSLQITACNLNLTGVAFGNSANLTMIDANVQISRCRVENTSVYFTFLTSRVDFEQVRFSNLSNSKSQMFFIHTKHVSFRHIHFQWINLNDVTKSFVDIEAAEEVALRHCVISHSYGLKNSSRLFLIKNVRKTILVNLTVKENTNSIIQVINTSPQILIIDDLKILGSVNTTLEAVNVRANVSRVVVEHLAKSNQPIISFNKSNVEIENLQIACVGKRRFERSPISVDSLTEVKCNNCSTLRCKNICGEGYQIVQDILCEQCPVGTSAHDWERKCRHCHPGFYSPKPGATDCIPCKKGKFCSRKGCSTCKDCGNDLFTSNPGSSSCSQMSQFFIIMLGVTLFLIMTPIAVKVICRNRPLSDDITDDIDASMRDIGDQKYKRFANNENKEEDVRSSDEDDNDENNIDYPSRHEHSLNTFP